MLERFFEHDTDGVLKALTLEWRCPKCSGNNFRILKSAQRATGEYHGSCRYCKAKYRVLFQKPLQDVEGEVAFLHRLELENFDPEEVEDMVRDFAEIASLQIEHAPEGIIREKWRALESKIAFAKRRRRL